MPSLIFLAASVITYIWLYCYSFNTEFSVVNLTEYQQILSILRRHWLELFSPFYEIPTSILALTAGDTVKRKKNCTKSQFLDSVDIKKNTWNKFENPVRDCTEGA